MSQDMYDKLTTDVTVKIAYTGNDVKLTIPDVKVTSVQVPVEKIASNKRIPLPPAPDQPRDVCKTVGKTDPKKTLPVDPDRVDLSFLAVKLAPNQKLAKPLWLAAKAFSPATRGDDAVKLEGETMAVFWDSSQFGPLLGPGLREGGVLWYFHENPQPVYIDIIAGYRRRTKGTAPPPRGVEPPAEEGDWEGEDSDGGSDGDDGDHSGDRPRNG